jgi:hypothetical protein
MTVSVVGKGSYLKLSDKLFRPLGQLDVLVPFSQANKSIILMTLCQSIQPAQLIQAPCLLLFPIFRSNTKRLSFFPYQNRPYRASIPTTPSFTANHSNL